MQERKGKLTDTMQHQIPWEKIFESPQSIFVLDPDEYSNIQSLRSSGISYQGRHGYTGVLHVLTGEEGEAQVQFEPVELAGKSSS